MLINYEFKNYKSYLNETKFQMNVNSDKTHLDHIINLGKDKVSKVKIIYGANASGKSSFIHSIDFLQMFTLLSNNMIEGQKIGVAPYKFKSNYASFPSEFSIVFYKNEYKYSYSFSCNSKYVINEKLDVYYSAKPTNIFTRTNTNEYKFNTDVKQLNEIRSKTTNNKLFLVTAATWNYEKVKPVVEYLMNDIVVLYDVTQPTKYTLDFIIKNGDYEEYKKFCIDFLNNADISIEDIDYQARKVKDLPPAILSNLMNFFPNKSPEELNQIQNVDVYDIYTKHKINNEIYPLNLIEESLGTQQLFYLAPVLFYVFKNGKTIFIDEIDKSLHPLLVEYIIKKFLNNDINKKNSQLICNTHDTNLLNLDLLRRDEIWFCDRNNINGVSELYSLADFSPRKDENINKAYMIGRFGAVPHIKEE